MKLKAKEIIAERQGLFHNFNTQADDSQFLELISSIDVQFRAILLKANILNNSHQNDHSNLTSTTCEAFTQQLTNDFSEIISVMDFVNYYGVTKLKERHWRIAKSMYQKYSFSGDIYQAIEKVDMPDSSRLKAVMAINSLLKNIDIYLKEQHFYEFYELCRSKFEPDTIETENNSVGEINTAK
jgi:hypothetical protein